MSRAGFGVVVVGGWGFVGERGGGVRLDVRGRHGAGLARGEGGGGRVEGLGEGVAALLLLRGAGVDVLDEWLVFAVNFFGLFRGLAGAGDGVLHVARLALALALERRGLVLLVLGLLLADLVATGRGE